MMLRRAMGVQVRCNKCDVLMEKMVGLSNGDDMSVIFKCPVCKHQVTVRTMQRVVQL